MYRKPPKIHIQATSPELRQAAAKSKVLGQFNLSMSFSPCVTCICYWWGFLWLERTNMQPFQGVSFHKI